MSSLYLDMVPKDPVENLRWRAAYREAAIKDHGVRQAIRQAAFQDVLFWFNALCWCFEPRAIVKTKPFLTWPHQDPAILVLDQSIDEAAEKEESIDVVADKSRGQGVTWMYLMILLRRWLRDESFTAGLVTRTEDLVDSSRNEDTLMWKIVWEIERLPTWMLPEEFDITKHRSLTEHSLYNPQTHSTIIGYSATGDVARGGRKGVFVMDELAAFKTNEDYAAMASTHYVTYCRWLVSTFTGDSGAYYDAARKESTARKVILDWKDNPTQNRYLYRVVKGSIFPVNEDIPPNVKEQLRKQHVALARRGYVVEGKVRSPWYNSKCLQPAVTPREIASELDRDPTGAAAKVFYAHILQEAKASCARPPLLVGRFVFDRETAMPVEPFIVPSESGELKLWCKLDINGRPRFSTYNVGADIGGGTGGAYTANSVAHVLDKMTGEQVAEWVSNTTEPRLFAFVCAALCRWFWNALLIPEANFDGGFFKAMEDTICYPNIWLRESQLMGLRTLTKKKGFWVTDDNARLTLLERMQSQIASGEYVPRSMEMLEECSEYEWRNGKIVHRGSLKTEDEGAKGKAHADRVVAASLSAYDLGESRISESVEQPIPDNAPLGSMAARMLDSADRKALEGDPWTESPLDIFVGSCSSGFMGQRDSWS